MRPDSGKVETKNMISGIKNPDIRYPVKFVKALSGSTLSLLTQNDLQLLEWALFNEAVTLNFKVLYVQEVLTHFI